KMLGVNSPELCVDHAGWVHMLDRSGARASEIVLQHGLEAILLQGKEIANAPAGAFRDMNEYQLMRRDDPQALLHQGKTWVSCCMIGIVPTHELALDIHQRIAADTKCRCLRCGRAVANS